MNPLIPKLLFINLSLQHNSIIIFAKELYTYLSYSLSFSFLWENKFGLCQNLNNATLLVPFPK